MKVERSNKAIYIYINQRALRQAAKKSQRLFKLSDDEALQLEKEVLAMIESKQELDMESLDFNLSEEPGGRSSQLRHHV